MTGQTCEPIPKRTIKPNPRHLAWVRGQPCSVPGCRSSKIEAHHVRDVATSGVGMKGPDEQAIPLCLKHHREYHLRGCRTFANGYNLDLDALVLQTREKSPHAT